MQSCSRSLLFVALGFEHSVANMYLIPIAMLQPGAGINVGYPGPPLGVPLRYGPGATDDEPGYMFDSHVFREGECVSITEHNGETRLFRVVCVV